MFNLPEMQRLVDMQHRSYLLLKWMAKAVSKGFVNFETAHHYSSLPEAAEDWIVGHYMNIPTTPAHFATTSLPFAISSQRI